MKHCGCTLDCLKTNLTLLRTFDGALQCVCVSPHKGISLATCHSVNVQIEVVGCDLYTQI